MTSHPRLLILSDYGDIQASRPEAECLIRLAQAGFDIHIVTYPSPYVSRLKEAGIEVSTLLTKKKFDRKFIGWLRNLITEESRDILYLFTSPAITNGIRAALTLPIKVVLYRGYTGNINWYDPTAYLKFLHPRVDKIVCIAESIVEYLEKQPFFPKGKAVTINKGHDPSWYEGHKPIDLGAFGIPEGAIVAACMANARRFKGIRYLLESTQHLQDLPNFHLLLIGRDMNTPSLTRLRTQSAMAERIHLSGYRTDPLSVLMSCQMFVLPSIKGEAITKSLIEAMSMGLPPVITNIPGNRNLVLHQQNGIVVPTKDPLALAEGIRLLHQDAGLRSRLGQRAKQHIATHFHIDRSVKELTEFFRELVS
ncbi:MAG: glycosyltransferase family 4 protein [Saprospiraceae bacterium]|nr:glycosyltransferase family 4 protein [Saprospiraceae bacterium]